MAERARTDLPADKAERYAALHADIAAVIAGEKNATARYASASCLLKQGFPETFFWVGFYVVDPDTPNELVVGPYQGSLGCLRIPFGKGVCGAAAQTRATVIVPDVHAFPGHIACDSRSRSEIVVPVIAPNGDLLAVLDVDATLLEAFDAVDQAGLEAICREIAAGL